MSLEVKAAAGATPTLGTLEKVKKEQPEPSTLEIVSNCFEELSNEEKGVVLKDKLAHAKDFLPPAMFSDIQQLFVASHPKNSLEELKAAYKLASEEEQKKIRKEIKENFIHKNLDEARIADTQKSLKTLDEAHIAHNKKIEEQIKTVSGLNSAIIPTSPNLSENKKKGDDSFNNYPPLYNQCCDLLSNLEKRQNKIQDVASNFAQLVLNWSTKITQYEGDLTALFKEMERNHYLLHTQVSGGLESYYGTVNIVRGNYLPIPVKGAPKLTPPDTKSSTSENSSTKEPLEVKLASFSPFIASLKTLDTDYETFLGKIQNHKELISKNRHSSLDKIKLGEEQKKLEEAYKKLHDECVDFYDKFKTIKDHLSSLDTGFKKEFDAQQLKISEIENAMFSSMKKLREEYLKLGTTIHGRVISLHAEYTREFKLTPKPVKYIIKAAEGVSS